MTIIKSAAIATAALLLGASTASAELVQVTLTGNSESVNDFDNVFGLGAETVGSTANITDQAFTETLILDTAGGNAANTSTFVSYSTFYGTTPPYALAASLEINGHTFSTLGSNGSYLAIVGSDYYGGSNDVSPTNASENNDISFDIHSIAGASIPSTVTQSFSTALDSTDYEVFDSFADSNSGGFNFDAAGTLDPTQLTITPVSSAPEPSAWLLMVGGVGAMAVVLRRAKAKLGSRSKGALAA